jgi:hypothetical protein
MYPIICFEEVLSQRKLSQNSCFQIISPTNIQRILCGKDMFFYWLFVFFFFVVATKLPASYFKATEKTILKIQELLSS